MKKVTKEEKISPYVPKRNHTFNFLVPALIFLVGILSYSNTFHSPFAFDDARIEERRETPSDISSLRTMVGQQRPTSYLSFDLNYQLAGDDPFGYHLINLIIHLLTAIIFYFLVLTTLNLPSLRDKYGTASQKAAAIASLLFVSHPVQTQAVTYIIQRMASLGAMFYLLSLLLYVKGRTAAGIKGVLFYIGSLLAALLAFGSKQHTVTLPLFIVLYDFFFFQELDFKKHKKTLGLLVSLLVLPLVAGILYTQNINWILKGYNKYHFTMGERLLTEFRVIIYYISLLLFPHPSRLNLDYDYPISHSLLNPPTTIICLLLLAGLIVSAIWMARKKPLYSFATFWFLGTLAPESTIIPIEIIYEHRLYLPSVGFFIIAALALVRLFDYVPARQRNLTQLAAITLLITLLGWWTYQRNEVWGSEISLWSDVVKKSPHKFRAYNNLGSVYSENGQYDLAIEALKRTLEINPKVIPAVYNLGLAYHKKGNYRLAEDYLQQALKMKADHPPIYHALGDVYSDQKRWEEAVRLYREAISLDSNYAPAYYNLGLIYQKSKNTDQALEVYNKLAKIRPNDPIVHYRLGKLYGTQGKYEMAVAKFTQTIKLDPKKIGAHHNLGLSYQNLGRYHQAAEAYLTALKLAPDNAAAYKNLGMIYLYNLPDKSKALECLSRSLELDPRQPQAKQIKQIIANLTTEIRPEIN